MIGIDISDWEGKMVLEEPHPIVSIVIPFFNRWDLTHQRLMELYKFAPDYCEIVLIDDASTEQEVRNGIAWWQHSDFIRHKIRYFKNQENLGFGGSLNIGAKLAKGRIIVHLSNDVIVSGDVISNIVTMIGQDDKILVCGRIVDFPGGWNEFDIAGSHVVVPYAEGWLLACTKTAWKSLGGFDPRYGKYDYEDMDLSVVALDKGFGIVALNSPLLQHMSGATIYHTDPNRQEHTQKNRIIFMEKWSFNLVAIMEKTNGTGEGS